MAETKHAEERRRSLLDMIRRKSEGDQPKPKSGVQEVLEAVGIAILIVFIIQTFIIRAFRIPSGSMEDTLLVGDFLLANKFVYGAQLPWINVRVPGLRDPRPGDIVIFRCPDDLKKDYIKRCIAVGGQTVEIRNKTVYVDSRPQKLPPLGKHIDPRVAPADIDPRDNYGPVVVPRNHFFCMGDNRDNSRDSRYWGFLPKKLLRGKAMVLYFSWESDPEVPLWNLAKKIRWGRIGKVIR